MADEWYEGTSFFRRFSFRFGDCDNCKRASLYTILKLLSEIAGDDYEGRGLGHKRLQEQGQVFLISRMSLAFDRIPEYADNIIAETWERTVSGPYFYRDYEVFGDSGEKFISGSSQWLLADPASRGILRPNCLPTGQRQSSLRKSDCPECKKIKKPDNLPVLGHRPIYYSDLDGNGHVNNAVYGKIAVDYLPDVLRQKVIKTFTVNYNFETKPEETLEIRGTETENGYLIQGVCCDKLHFCCEFGY